MPQANPSAAKQKSVGNPFPASGDEASQRDKSDAILWIRTAMARHGITLAQLEAIGCFESSTARHAMHGPAKYKDAQGHCWDGTGELPEWLQRAVCAGQSIDHFKIA